MSSYYTYLLTESRSDYILKNKDNIDKIYNVLSKNIDIKEKDKEQAVRKFLEDLESNKSISKYLNWVVKQYINGRWIYPEDVSNINSYLDKFNRSLAYIKNNGLETDLNKYDMASFNKLILNLPETKRQEEIQIKDNEIKKVYENEDYKVIVPLTKEAAILYGKGTTWCTAHTKSDNMFDYYNSEGDIYILLNEDPDLRLQFHLQSNQFMDIYNNPIDLEKFFYEYQDLGEFFYKRDDLLNWSESIDEYFKAYKHNITEDDVISCIEAADEYGWSIEDFFFDIPTDLRTKDVCLKAIEYTEDIDSISNTIPKKIWADEDFAKKAFNYNVECFPEIYEEYITPEMAEKAVEHNGYYIKYVPVELRTKKICLLALKENPYMADLVPENYWDDEDFCKEALKLNDSHINSFISIEYYTPEMKSKLPIEELWNRLPDRLKTYDICMEIVKKDWSKLATFPENASYKTWLDATKIWKESITGKSYYNSAIKWFDSICPEQYREQIKKELNL